MSDNAHLGPRGPSVYHGLVERSLIDEAMKTGPLFDSQTPDLFSGTLLSAILAEHDESFIHINEPVTAAALSGKSNGVAHLTSDDNNEIREDFRSLNSSSGLEFHPELPDLHILFVYIHDTLFRVRDRLGLADSKLRKTPAEIADGCSLGIFQSEPALTGEVNELRRFVEANNLEMRPEWEERMAHPVGKHHPIFHDEGRIGAGEGYINLSGRDLDLHDVVQASAPTSAIRETSRLYQEQIGELRQDVETRDQRIRQLEEESERLSHRLSELRRGRKSKRHALSPSSQRAPGAFAGRQPEQSKRLSGNNRERMDYSPSQTRAWFGGEHPPSSACWRSRRHTAALKSSIRYQPSSSLLERPVAEMSESRHQRTHSLRCPHEGL